MLGDKTAFLNQYAIPEKMYEEAGMSWADLKRLRRTMPIAWTAFT